MKKLLLIQTLIVLIISVQAQISIGTKKYGIGFGNPAKYNGILLNAYKNKSSNINGIAISLISFDKAKKNGINFTIYDHHIREINGANISLIYNNARHSKGIVISGLLCKIQHLHGFVFSPIHEINHFKGVSIGIFSKIGQFRGLQLNAINFVHSNSFSGYSYHFPQNTIHSGVQIGFLNYSDYQTYNINEPSRGPFGIQFGLVNYSEWRNNFIQIGLININKNNPKMLRILPLINIGLGKEKKVLDD